MELLNSFSKFQQLTSNLYESSSVTNKHHTANNTTTTRSNKDMLDLSELNDSLNQQSHIRQMQQQQSNYFKQQPLTQQSKIPKPNPNAANDESSTSSMAGSYISDTLTLNADFGLNNINTNNNGNKYFRLAKPSELAVIGKGISLNARRNSIVETYEDEKTENDQDQMDEDEDEDEEEDVVNVYDESDEFGTGGLKRITNNLEHKETIRNLQAQRLELLNALNGDLSTLEQLREQKKLLRSIRLRKEELKALEGRRKALEALKKIGANENDEGVLGEIKESLLSEELLLLDNEEEEEEKKEQRKSVGGVVGAPEGFRREDEKKLKEFENFLNMLKEKQVIFDLKTIFIYFRMNWKKLLTIKNIFLLWEFFLIGKES